MRARSRWTVVWLLFAGGLISYMDRAALSITAPLVMKELHLDAQQMGWVFSSFFTGYALFCFAGGYASDAIGAKRVLTIAMTVWSVFCSLTATARGFVSLFSLRIIFGCGEGPFSSAANKMVNNWFGQREAGRALSIAQGGTALGGAVAGPVVGWVALRFGWRISFVAVGAIGLLWMLVWSASVAEKPSESRAIGSEEATKSGAERALPLSEYLKRPAIVNTAIAFFGYNYILYFFLSWFPSYLTMRFRLSVQNMSIVTAIPWLVGFAGLACSGPLSDFLFRRSGNALLSRKTILVSCLLLTAACLGLAGSASEVRGAVLFMSAAIFFLYLTGTTYWSIIQDTVPQSRVGGASGFVHFVANCSGIAGPAVTGSIVQRTNSFTGAFLLAGLIAVLSAVLVAMYVRPVARLR